ncbi:MAG: redoxin domain-containing protein [Dehalococcoidia bacterium]|nr:redoxin domain-containing protein [Dehalococcoidia bacterium]
MRRRGDEVKQAWGARTLWAAIAVVLLVTAACGGESPADGTGGSPETTAPEGRSWAGKEPAPEFPGGLSWFNVDAPVELEDLRGKMVLLDFWTLGCINCQHIVPDLERLEEEFADSLVVIGVHSGKYATEHSDESVEDAVHRLGIEHPVVNDPDLVFWERYGANAWPTLMLIDPAGKLVGAHAGEGVYDLFQPILSSLEQEFADAIDRTPFPVNPEQRVAATVLKYPGAIAADPANRRLYIADSGHNRVLVANLKGELQQAIGTGQAGFADGGADEATFNQPHGLALSADGRTLYVADTRNHAIREVDTANGDVRTIAGTGNRAERLPRAGADPRETALASPWGLASHEGRLYIGMAGVHQLWSMDPEGNSIEVFAGTSREGINDGARLTEATLAQPSGLTAGQGYLYWVDPEASAARRVGFGDEALVDTLIGTGLFDYGNEDGGPGEGQLQHPQGIVFANEALYIADTYNHAVRTLNPGSRTLRTLAGTMERGWNDGAGSDAQFDEPGGITYADGVLYVADTNNHLVRVVDPDTGTTGTLQLTNIEAIEGARGPGNRVEFIIPKQRVAPGFANLQLRVAAPEGHHLNSLAPSRFELRSSNGEVIHLGEDEVSWSSDEQAVEVPVPVELAEGETTLTASGEAYFCRDGQEALCLITRVEVVAPIEVAEGAEGGEVRIEVTLPDGDAS